MASNFGFDDAFSVFVSADLQRAISQATSAAGLAVLCVEYLLTLPLELKLYLQSGRRTSKILFCLVRYLSLTCVIALFCVQWDIPDNRTSCHAAVRLAVVAEMISMLVASSIFLIRTYAICNRNAAVAGMLAIMMLSQAGIAAFVIVGFQPIYLPQYGLLGVEASGVVCTTTLPRLWIVAIWAGLNCLYDSTVLFCVLYALSRPKLAGSTPFISALKTSQVGYMALTASIYLTATVLFAVKLVYAAYFLPFIPALVCIAVQRVVLADSPTSHQHLSLSVGSSDGSPSKGRLMRYRGQSHGSSAEDGLPSIRNSGFEVTHHQPPNSLNLIQEAHALSRLEGKHLQAQAEEPEPAMLRRAATVEARYSRKLSARSDSLSRLKWFSGRSATERPFGPLRPVSQVSAQLSLDAEKAGATNRSAWDNDEAWHRDHILLERPSLRVINSTPTPPPSDVRNRSLSYSGEALATPPLPLFNARSSLQSFSRYPTFGHDGKVQQQDDVWAQHHHFPVAGSHHNSWPASTSDLSGNHSAWPSATRAAENDTVIAHDYHQGRPLSISAIRAQLASGIGTAEDSEETVETPRLGTSKPVMPKRCSEPILPGQVPWLVSGDGGNAARFNWVHVRERVRSERAELESTETLACGEEEGAEDENQGSARKDEERDTKSAEEFMDADETHDQPDDVSASPTHWSVRRVHHANSSHSLQSQQAHTRQRMQSNASRSTPTADQANGETSATAGGIYMTQETVTTTG